DVRSGQEIVAQLLEKSNFEAVNQILGDLSRKARFRQLVSIVDTMEEKVAPLNSESVNSGKCLEDIRAMLREYQLVGDGLICFGGRDGVLMVEQASGKEVWRHNTKDTVISPPLVYGGIVVFGCYDGWLYGVDILANTVRWKLEIGEKSWFDLTISDGVLFLGTPDQHVYAVDAHTGVLMWRFRTNGRVLSAPAVHNGTVFFGSDYGKLYAVDVETGSLRWEFNKGDWRCASATVVKGMGEITGPPRGPDPSSDVKQ